MYRVRNGKVYGGSDIHPRGRSVRPPMAKDDGFFYIGGDFKMELDYGKKSLSMVVDEEKITIDENIGELQFSPIVILHKLTKGYSEVKVSVTLL